MRVSRIVFFLALSLGLLGPAAAQDVDTRWYVAPSVSYTNADCDRCAPDDALGMRLGLGKVFGHFWNVELTGGHESFDLERGGAYRLTHLAVDGLFFFNRDSSFAPFALLGVGGMRTEVFDFNERGIIANAGLGFVSSLSDGANLRGDVRYRWDDNSTDVFGGDSLGDLVATLGVQIKIGRRMANAGPTVSVVSAAKPASPDSDHDGVSDDLDRCPLTPAGAKVDANGCELDADGDGVVDRLDQCPRTPTGAKVDANGCELDSDGDGVVDRLDPCPGTPAGRKVDAKGCELDSDGDGILDFADACPSTPAGDRVDSKGCTLLDVIVLKGVTFDNDKADLRADAIAILDDAVSTLKRYPALKVEVAGHTDSKASATHNQKLSERRAQAVMDYFVGKGIEADRLTAKGYGEAQPIATNATAEGRLENRRVELRIAK